MSQLFLAHHLISEVLSWAVCTTLCNKAQLSPALRKTNFVGNMCEIIGQVYLEPKILQHIYWAFPGNVNENGMHPVYFFLATPLCENSIRNCI